MEKPVREMTLGELESESRHLDRLIARARASALRDVEGFEDRPYRGGRKKNKINKGRGRTRQRHTPALAAVRSRSDCHFRFSTQGAEGILRSKDKDS